MSDMSKHRVSAAVMLQTVPLDILLIQDIIHHGPGVLLREP